MLVEGQASGYLPTRAVPEAMPHGHVAIRLRHPLAGWRWELEGHGVERGRSGPRKLWLAIAGTSTGPLRIELRRDEESPRTLAAASLSHRPARWARGRIGWEARIAPGRGSRETWRAGAVIGPLAGFRASASSTLSGGAGIGTWIDPEADTPVLRFAGAVERTRVELERGGHARCSLVWSCTTATDRRTVREWRLGLAWRTGKEEP